MVDNGDDALRSELESWGPDTRATLSRVFADVAWIPPRSGHRSDTECGGVYPPTFGGDPRLTRVGASLAATRPGLHANVGWAGFLGCASPAVYLPLRRCDDDGGLGDRPYVRAGPYGTQRPVRRSASWASLPHQSHSSRTRRVLPTPASPMMVTACGAPDDRTRAYASCRSWRSASRPTNVGRRPGMPRGRIRESARSSLRHSTPSAFLWPRRASAHRTRTRPRREQPPAHPPGSRPARPPARASPPR